MPDESEKERVDRELIELLNELRVALPGVQVLFAFLLAVPFQQRWQQVSAFQRDTYFGTLLCTFLATVAMIAPSALHRLNFRMQRKQRIVMTSNRLMLVGMAMLGLALVGVLMLIGDFLFGTAAAVITPALGAVAILLVWAWLPLGLRAKGRREDPPDSQI